MKVIAAAITISLAVTGCAKTDLQLALEAGQRVIEQTDECIKELKLSAGAVQNAASPNKAVTESLEKGTCAEAHKSIVLYNAKRAVIPAPVPESLAKIDERMRIQSLEIGKVMMDTINVETANALMNLFTGSKKGAP